MGALRHWRLRRAKATTRLRRVEEEPEDAAGRREATTGQSPPVREARIPKSHFTGLSRCVYCRGAFQGSEQVCAGAYRKGTFEVLRIAAARRHVPGPACRAGRKHRPAGSGGRRSRTRSRSRAAKTGRAATAARVAKVAYLCDAFQE